MFELLWGKTLYYIILYYIILYYIILYYIILYYIILYYIILYYIILYYIILYYIILYYIILYYIILYYIILYYIILYYIILYYIFPQNIEELCLAVYEYGGLNITGLRMVSLKHYNVTDFASRFTVMERTAYNKKTETAIVSVSIS